MVFHAWEPGAALRLPQAICFRRSAAVAPAFNNPCMGDRNKAQTKDRNRPEPHSKSAIPSCHFGYENDYLCLNNRDPEELARVDSPNPFSKPRQAPAESACLSPKRSTTSASKSQPSPRQLAPVSGAECDQDQDQPCERSRFGDDPDQSMTDGDIRQMIRM